MDPWFTEQAAGVVGGVLGAVIGGGFGAALPLLRPGIEEGLTERAYGREAGDYRILGATLGPDAGWIGAARVGQLRAQENRD